MFWPRCCSIFLPTEYLLHCEEITVLREGTATKRLGIVILTFCLFLLMTAPVLADDSIKIVINKKVNKLAYLKNGVVEKIFPVATGRRASYTPEGSFRVVRKLVKPAYRKLKIPGGSPRNPLGARWLGFNARGTSGGTYGIHGTNNPRSIGKYASGGCIRMYNQDVIWLYDHVPVNTVVEIINRDWDLEQKPVSLSVNGIRVTGTHSAYLSNSRVIVPAKLLSSKLGIKVNWPAGSQKVTFTYGKNAMSATVGSYVIYVNGVEKRMDAIAVMKNGELFIPVRAFSQIISMDLNWDYDQRTLFINHKLSNDAGLSQNMEGTKTALK